MTTAQITAAMQRFRLRYAVAPTHILLDQDTLDRYRAANKLERNPSMLGGLKVIENFDGINAVCTMESL